MKLTQESRADHSAVKPQLKLALVLGMFSALGPFTVDMYLSSLPQLADAFGSSASIIQFSLTAGLLGLALGQLVMGPLSDIHGRRRPLAISMVLYLAVSIACACSPNIESFIVLRFIQGFVASAGLVISRAIVRDTYSGPALTAFISMLTMISNIAPLISPVAGSAVSSFSSWRGVFLSLGLLGVILTSLSVWGIKETLPLEHRSKGRLGEIVRTYGGLLRDRAFMGYALVTGLLFAGVFAYVAGTPFIYQNMYGVKPLTFSILFALNGGAIMVGSQVVRRLASGLEERRLLAIGLAVSSLSSGLVLLIVLVHGPLIAFVAALFGFAVSIGIIGPVTFSLAMESQGHRAGTAAAILGILPYLLGSLASPIVGLAGDHSATPFGILIFTSSLLAIGVGLVKERETMATSSSWK